MDIVHPRVGGIDVHKKVIWVAVRLPGTVPGERKVITKSFKTLWRSLQKMASWLAELGVTDAAMESTGVTGIYWWPVYHALAAPGSGCACATRRTCATCRAARPAGLPVDRRAARVRAAAAQFHPGRRGGGAAGPHPLPQAADRGAHRRGPAAFEGVGGAGIKIDSVASELLGKSGRAMIEALIAGERNRGRLADLAKGVLRRKTDALQLACDGRFTASHAQMCRLHLDAYDHLTAQIAAVDELVAEAAAPFAALPG
jgi:transposase